jgi:hypothetical protein
MLIELHIWNNSRTIYTSVLVPFFGRTSPRRYRRCLSSFLTRMRCSPVESSYASVAPQ